MIDNFAIFWLCYSLFLEGIKVTGMQISHWLITWASLQRCFTSTSGVGLVLWNTVSVGHRGASFLLHTPYTCELEWLCQYAWFKLGMQSCAYCWIAWCKCPTHCKFPWKCPRVKWATHPVTAEPKLCGMSEHSEGFHSINGTLFPFVIFKPFSIS